MLEPEPSVIYDHLEHLMRDAKEHCPAALVQIDCGHPTTKDWGDQLFGLGRLNDATDFAAAENRRGLNLYVGINPRKPTTRRSATDADIECAFFNFADIDRQEAVQKVAGMTGLNYTFAVTTGRVPNPRPHLYWKLSEPTRNFAAWTKQQAAIADALGGDRVIDPRRIMRLAGTVNYPKPDKAERGYRTELVTLRTRYDNEERDPVSSEWLRQRFPWVAEQVEASPGALALSPFSGASPDELIAEIRAGGEWHNKVLRLVGHYVSTGLTDETILAVCEALTRPGYTVSETRTDALRMIQGARVKWHTPNPIVNLDGSPTGSAATEAADDGPFPATALVGDPPPRHWIVPDWLPASEATGLYGDGGVGKTLVAQQIGAAVATGSDFMGMKVTPMPVLAVLCEDDRNELHRRQHAINKWLDCAMHPQLGQLQLWPRVGRDNFLAIYNRDGQHQLTPFYQRLFGLVSAIAGSKLLILDTLADLFGGNEIIRIQANHFVKAIVGRLVREAGATVLVLAHPSQAGMQTDGGSSGSTGWSNAFRQRLYLKKTEEEGANYDRELIRKKANYASTDPADCLKMVWENGVLTNMGQGPKVVSPDFATRILKGIQIRWMDGNPFSPYARSGPFYLIPWMVREHGFSRGEAATLMNGWISTGLMVVDMVNSKTKRQGLKVVKWPG